MIRFLAITVQTAMAELDVVVKTYYDEIRDFKYDKNMMRCLSICHLTGLLIILNR